MKVVDEAILAAPGIHCLMSTHQAASFHLQPHQFQVACSHSHLPAFSDSS